MNNTYCFNMSDLFSQASYAFIITMPNCKVGKEGIHQLLIEVIKRYGNSYLANKWNRWSNSDGNLTCFYFEEPFGNLRFKELVTITDNAISYKYVEQTDQKVMLPNIQNFIYMMLFAVKTAEQLQGGFEKHSAKCEVKIENNADANIAPGVPGRRYLVMVKANEPRPMAKPAKIPKSNTFKYFILENWFVINESFDIRATINA